MNEFGPGDNPEQKSTKLLGQLTLNGQKWEFVVEDHTGDLSLFAILPDGDKQSITDVTTEGGTASYIPNEIGQAVIDSLSEDTDQLEEYNRIMKRYDEELKSLVAVESEPTESQSLENKNVLVEADPNNGHEVGVAEIGDHKFEFIKQARAGDCVLINFLNTYSFAHDGTFPMTIKQAREAAISMRQDRKSSTDPNYHSDLEPEEIRGVDVPLEYQDMFDLFAMIYDETARNGDMEKINGTVPDREIRQKIGQAIDKINNYDSKTCSLGLGKHSTTVMEAGGNYLYLDPFDAKYVKALSRDELEDKIFSYAKGHAENDNIFLYLRKAEDNIREARENISNI